MNLHHFEKMDSYIPTTLDLLSWKGFWLTNLVVSAFLMARYFIMVAPVYFIFTRPGYLKAKQAKPKKGQVLFEIRYSLGSTIIFSLSAYVMALFWQKGGSQIYLSFEDYPLWYMPLSFFIYALVHEVYFYFTHIWMHKPQVYRVVHSVHHYSHRVTPWASFSFHPYECLVHALFIPLMVLLVPTHPLVLLSYLVFMTVTAISNHSAREWISSAGVKEHFISGDHHRRHHEHFNGNFGLYFCFMDRWMGTEIPVSSIRVEHQKIGELQNE